jgi:hypothetical protein
MKFLHVLFRFLLGVSLIAVALNNFKNISTSENEIVKNVNNWKFQFKGLDTIFENVLKYTNIIALVHIFSFGLAGFFVIFGLKGSGFITIIALLLELTLINSPLFTLNEKTITHTIKILAIYGGVINS